MNKRRWNTFRVVGYTHQVGDDSRATGGVQLQQVKLGDSSWFMRKVDSNGRHRSAGPVSPVSAPEGEAAWETAKAA